MTPTVYRHPDMSCPVCGYVVQAATAVFGHHAEPFEGDLAVCIACTAVNVYASEARGLRLPTADEQALFRRSRKVQAAVRATKAARARHPDWSPT